MTISFFLYLFASVLMFINIPIRNNKVNKISFLLIISGFVLHTIYLTMRSLIGWHLPVTGMYEYISLLAWAIILLTTIIQITRKLSFLTTIIAPIAMILIVISSLFPKEIETQLVPALKSYWLTIHVILASIGEGAFAIAFALAIFYLIKGDRKGGMLPSKIKLEEIAYKAVLVGYPFFTIGALIAGAIWAEQAWGSWWSWDPKETCSLIVWLVATAYLHARITRGWRGKRSIFLVIVIFLLSLFTLFSNMIFGGLHSYGTGI
jgi:cytochrome c-type biogenesis protein CcsB